jgi:hypothetical protein
MIKVMAIIIAFLLMTIVGLIAYHKAKKIAKLPLSIPPYEWGIFAAMLAGIGCALIIYWLSQLGIYPA